MYQNQEAEAGFNVQEDDAVFRGGGDLDLSLSSLYKSPCVWR